MTDEALDAKRDRVAQGFFEGWRQICVDIESTPTEAERVSMREAVDRLPVAEIEELFTFSDESLAREFILRMRGKMYEACQPENNPGESR